MASLVEAATKKLAKPPPLTPEQIADRKQQAADEFVVVAQDEDWDHVQEQIDALDSRESSASVVNELPVMADPKHSLPRVDSSGLLGLGRDDGDEGPSLSRSASAGAAVSRIGAAQTSRAHHVGKKFQNPWDTWEAMGVKKGLSYLISRKHPDPPPKKVMHEQFPVETPDMGHLLEPDPAVLQVMWCGHASFLIQIAGCAVLTDPVWSERCSPVAMFGPKRITPPPCEISELPRIDFVCISHNHYDHLDLATLRELHQRFKPTFLVGLGVSATVSDHGMRVRELDWWQDFVDDYHSVTFTFVPAQHWSCRDGVLDRNSSLWGGWVVSTRDKKCYFSGDTGYCPVFKELGHRVGPFDVALLPLGAYEPRKIMKPQHCNPVESVTVHTEVRSKLSIGMHWGTFILSNEAVLDPPIDLVKALVAAQVPLQEFIPIRIGRIMKVGVDDPMEMWNDFSWALHAVPDSHTILPGAAAAAAVGAGAVGAGAVGAGAVGAGAVGAGAVGAGGASVRGADKVRVVSGGYVNVEPLVVQSDEDGSGDLGLVAL